MSRWTGPENPVSSIVSVMREHFTPSASDINLTALNDDAHVVPLSVQRTLRGSSQARGELSVIVTNHEAVEMQAIYLETMPWLLQFYLHTLRISCNGEPRGKTIHHPRGDVLSDVGSPNLQMTSSQTSRIRPLFRTQDPRRCNPSSIYPRRAPSASLLTSASHSSVIRNIRLMRNEAGICRLPYLSPSA